MSTLRTRPKWFTFGGLAVGIVAAAAMAILSATPAKPVRAADSSQDLNMVNALSNAFGQVAEKASPAVVHIRVEKEVKAGPALFDGRGPMGPGFFRYFFGPGMGDEDMQEFPGSPNMPGRQGKVREIPVPMGEGSGFVISEDGYIVTNHHVVGDADRVRVYLEDGREFTAKIVGSDPQTEIALIKVDATGLPTLQLGDSERLRVGEWVLAIGSPFGLQHSVTSGIVSACGRGNVGIVDYADFIQTDAAINPGNSGGPLLNMNGEVVGMNTAIVSRAGGNDGVGFAIPVNMVKYIVEQLREDGKVTRGFLGILIQDLTPELAKSFGISEGHGIVVADVTKDSPAERAGLKRGDVIVAYDGRPVGEGGAFRSHVSTTPAGKKIELSIIRDGKKIDKTIEVGSKPSEELAKANDAQPEQESNDLGIVVQALTDDIAKRLGYEGETGVVVAQVEPNSAAARAGIRPGALIKEVNRKEVNNPREFQEAVKRGSKDKTALLLVREGQGSRYVALDAA